MRHHQLDHTLVTGVAIPAKMCTTETALANHLDPHIIRQQRAFLTRLQECLVERQLELSKQIREFMYCRRLDVYPQFLLDTARCEFAKIRLGVAFESNVDLVAQNCQAIDAPHLVEQRLKRALVALLAGLLAKPSQKVALR